MFEPGQSDLLDPIIVYAVEGSVEDRMIRCFSNPVDRLITDVAHIGADREGGSISNTAVGLSIEDVADDQVRPRVEAIYIRDGPGRQPE
jgi:hypothetical protein